MTKSTTVDYNLSSIARITGTPTVDCTKCTTFWEFFIFYYEQLVDTGTHDILRFGQKNYRDQNVHHETPVAF